MIEGAQRRAPHAVRATSLSGMRHAPRAPRACPLNGVPLRGTGAACVGAREQCCALGVGF